MRGSSHVWRLTQMGLFIGDIAPLLAQPIGPPGPAAPAPNSAELGITTPAAGDIGHWLDKFGGPTTIVIIAAVIIGIIGLVFFLRRSQGNWENTQNEPEQPRSRFEQLLAEIQGLKLRLAGGESPGYYRKIEILARVFLERNGFPDARQMNDRDIKAILGGGQLPPQQAQILSSILERCRQGAEHENEKLDFTAVELLKDLHTLVYQVEGGGPVNRHA